MKLYSSELKSIFNVTSIIISLLFTLTPSVESAERDEEVFLKASKYTVVFGVN